MHSTQHQGSNFEFFDIVDLPLGVRGTFLCDLVVAPFFFGVVFIWHFLEIKKIWDYFFRHFLKIEKVWDFGQKRPLEKIKTVLIFPFSSEKF